MGRRVQLTLVLTGIVLTLVLVARPAEAQGAPALPASQTPAAPKQQKPRVPPPPDTRRWEIVVYRGFGLGEATGGGSGELPAAGNAFTTAGGSPSRLVSSWAFGDGAVLLNEVLATFGRPERITPLDNALTARGTDYEVEHGFGVRVTRALTPRMALEVGVDYAPASVTLVPVITTYFQNTRDSFMTAFDGLVATGQGVAFTNPVMSASFTTSNATGNEILATGALVFGPRRQGRLHPYVAVGGGVAKASGEAVASFVGRYAFTLPSGARVSEADTVTVRFSGGLGFVALAGAGLDVRLTRASGVQVDGRYVFVENHIDTLVDTAPDVASSVPADAIWSSFTPGIQFVTNPSTGLASNLSAPALSGFRTLKGSGFEGRLILSVGYYFRF